MTTREDWIEAIERYGDDRVAWSHETRFGQKRPLPQAEDYVGHLLPDDKGVPPGMELDERAMSIMKRQTWQDKPLYCFPDPADEGTGPVDTSVDNHAYGSYKPAWDGPAVPTKETEHG